MLYMGYFIILDGHNIKKNQFRKIPFLTCRGWKTASVGCALAALGPPPNTQTG